MSVATVVVLSERSEVRSEVGFDYRALVRQRNRFARALGSKSVSFSALGTAKAGSLFAAGLCLKHSSLLMKSLLCRDEPEYYDEQVERMATIAIRAVASIYVSYHKLTNRDG